MPTKAELYAQMADKVATQLTGSWQEWAGFLTTASRLYKYPFHEQLMIYAQRPDATACAEYDLWNEKMGRYVRRGSKGIALVDDSGDRPRLRYVFDISDTGTREHSRTPWLWQLEERHLDSVQAMLERTYDVSGEDLGLLSTVIALLGVAVLITYSPQNGVILLVMAFLISPMGLPLAAIWLMGKVQSLKFAIQDWIYG